MLQMLSTCLQGIQNICLKSSKAATVQLFTTCKNILF